MRYWKGQCVLSRYTRSHDSCFLTETFAGVIYPDAWHVTRRAKGHAKTSGRAAATVWVCRPSRFPPATSRLGIENLFDGKTFDPENPQAYVLDSLAI